MTSSSLSQTVPAKAERLRALHVPGDPVILPNAWDSSSADVFAKAGFPAIATSSSAVAATLGFSDGENMSQTEMFSAVARIATTAAEIPVTADVERGYGLTPPALVEALAAAGAAGCNLEDSDPGTHRMIEVSEQAAWLSEVRSACVEAAVPLVLNARIDVFLRDSETPADRMDDALRRADAYLEAGADCVYPIGLHDADEIGRFVAATRAPVNIVFFPGGPSLADLASLGVARVSYGGGLQIAVSAWLADRAARILKGEDPYARRRSPNAGN